MKIKSICISLSVLFLKVSLFAQTAGQVKILFDNTHAETSGTTADWCIDADVDNMNWGSGTPSGYTCTTCTHANPQNIPTPAQSGITSSTAETYWTGALSYWAIDCVRRGYWVETLPFGSNITYGSTSNPLDLSHYNVFVVDEPNTRFTQTEIMAMMNFIENGGSLFAISDHSNSDRNGDGWDSPMIWNDFMTNNPVLNTAFGYTFALENFSGTSNNVVTSTSDSITHGPFGSVAEVQWSNGTCMTLNPSQNPSVKAHVWKTGIGQTSDTAVLCVTARWKCGKIASIGDSSPPDDGTGNPHSTLYTGYTGDASGYHRPWLMNIMIWLAEGGTCGQTAEINSINQNTNFFVYPNPMINDLTIRLPLMAQKANVSIVDVIGKEVVSVDAYSTTEISLKENNLTAGIYFVKVVADGKFLKTEKIIKQ